MFLTMFEKTRGCKNHTELYFWLNNQTFGIALNGVKHGAFGLMMQCFDNGNEFEQPCHWIDI